MPRKVGHTLSDILETIKRVQETVAGKNFADFERDWTLRLAIQRAVEIISEASRRLPNELKATRREIPWPSIAGIGNVLRHDYQRTADRVIWDVVHKDLPALKTAVEAIAKAVDDVPKG